MIRIPKSWLVYSLERSHLLFGMTIGDVTQAEAQRLTDGPEGWSILEIVCHVRDYQEIWLVHVQRMLQEDHPTLVAYDAAAREALITQNQYAQQDLKLIFEDYVQTRHKFIAVVAQLEDSQLLRTGLNPLSGDIDLRVTIFHTIMHDIDHAEQIGRVRGLQIPKLG